MLIPRGAPRSNLAYGAVVLLGGQLIENEFLSDRELASAERGISPNDLASEGGSLEIVATYTDLSKWWGGMQAVAELWLSLVHFNCLPSKDTYQYDCMRGGCSKDILHVGPTQSRVDPGHTTVSLVLRDTLCTLHATCHQRQSVFGHLSCV